MGKDVTKDLGEWWKLQGSSLCALWTMNVTSVLSKGVAGEYFLDELKVGMVLREIQH